MTEIEQMLLKSLGEFRTDVDRQWHELAAQQEQWQGEIEKFGEAYGTRLYELANALAISDDTIRKLAAQQTQLAQQQNQLAQQQKRLAESVNALAETLNISLTQSADGTPSALDRLLQRR